MSFACGYSSSFFQSGRPLFDVRLYALPVPHRQTIALVPDHYVTLQSLKTFLEALKEAAAETRTPPVGRLTTIP